MNPTTTHCTTNASAGMPSAVNATTSQFVHAGGRHHRGNDSANLKQRLAVANGQLRNAAWLIELLQTILRQPTVAAAMVETAAQFKRHLAVESVAIARTNRRGQLRIAAISDVARLDVESDVARQFLAIAGECDSAGLPPGAASVWPPLDSTAADGADDAAAIRDGLHAHRKLAGSDRFVVAVPIRDVSDRPIATLIYTGRRVAPSTIAASVRFAVAAATPLAEAWSVCHRAEKPAVLRCIDRIQTMPLARRIAWACSITALLAAAWIPVPYRIAADALATPVQRRYAVAPEDGLLMQTLVRPGDVVTAGQVIAEMDGRALQWDLTGLIADRDRAIKQRDKHLAAKSTAESVQAALEVDRIAARIDAIRLRQTRLTLSSPIDGIVIDGPDQPRINQPVASGDVIYQIAPLRRMTMELSIDADVVDRVRPGATGALTFDGGDQRVDITIDRIRPASEIRDENNVFVAQCEVDNTDGHLRVGMRGRVKLDAGRRPLHWVLLHRMWHNLRRAWWW